MRSFKSRWITRRICKPSQLLFHEEAHGIYCVNGSNGKYFSENYNSGEPIGSLAKDFGTLLKSKSTELKVKEMTAAYRALKEELEKNYIKNIG